ncbi:MAG: PASTA domain-containing protein [Acidobacteriota bacterium]
MKLPGRQALRRHIILAAKLAALGILLAVVAAYSAYFTVRRSISGREVEVPDLTGMTVEAATASLEAHGLVLEEAARRNDDRLQAGLVLEQDPPPGTGIKIQRKVKVVVSLGDRVNPIPDFRGGAARKAQITLQQQGMKMAGQVYVYTRREEENLVIGQDPHPGSAGWPEGGIGLLISRGDRPLTYVMPDLIGRPQAQVLSFLSRSGLRPGPVRRAPGHPAPAGTVVAQSPLPGYPVRHGDLVTLTVAARGGEGG